MKKIVLFLLLFSFVNNCYALSSEYIAVDVDSGRVLEGSNINKKRLIASTTKIMTCLVVLENFDLNKEIVVGEEVVKMYGTNIYLSVGEEMKVIDLLYGLMLRSGNDAAITLAVNLCGSEESFVYLMNKKARELGMKNTSFENCHGLDDSTKNYSTAYDMSLLSRYAYNNKTYRKIISTKKYSCKSSVKTYIWYNRMSLLNKYKYCVGGKNGYTPRAKKSLVSYSKKNNMTVSVVSLFDNDIYSNHASIYNKVFKKYNRYLILDKNSLYGFYIKKDYYYPLKSDEVDTVSVLIKMYKETLNNNNAGEAEILLGNKKVNTIKIYKKSA